ncbi:MAG: GTPase Era [Deferribacteres bacterium]|nr:GTPase Era [candidate division KSB1 bacterium]MCB9500518.1 GTPase Era [Deferribacteres bacterium]
MHEKDYASYKCGYVAILGRPNVGKSTLLNNILEFKLCIVTPKSQTTRHRILGIYCQDDMQIIFLDTPGLIKPRYKLHEYLVKSAESAAKNADVHLFLIEAGDKINPEDAALLQGLVLQKKPIIIGINKTDKVPKSQLLPLIEQCANQPGVVEVVPISALQNDGINDLLSGIKKVMPYGAPLYPEDQLTTEPERFFVSELIREQIFHNYGDEIPYSTTVTVEEFKERAGRKDYVRATILVERPSQKAILIGKHGAALKKVGAESRKEIEQMLGRDVFLDLFVAVRPKWRDKENMLRNLGYN